MKRKPRKASCLGGLKTAVLVWTLHGGFGSHFKSWRFHGSFMAVSRQFHGSFIFVEVSWQFHSSFNSWQFDGSFMAVSWQVHGSCMVVSWQFHGSFRRGYRITDSRRPHECICKQKVCSKHVAKLGIVCVFETSHIAPGTAGGHARVSKENGERLSRKYLSSMAQRLSRRVPDVP